MTGITNVELYGLDQFQAAMKAFPNQTAEIAATVLNDQVSDLKTQAASDLAAATGVPAKLLRFRLAVRRAKASQLEAKLVPSSAGLPAKAYRHVLEATDSPTRARIVVAWLNGQKLAAGFINPLGRLKAPLSARVKGATRNAPKDALGPSVAAQLKVWRTDELLDGTRTTLAERFALAMAKTLES